MEKQDFTTTISVHTPIQEAFALLLNVRAWWSGLFGESFEGSSQKVGDEFSFWAGDGAHYSKQKMVELVPNQRVRWQVMESNLSFANKTDEWNGTQFGFELSEHAGQTHITFTHIGLVPQFECYDSCAPAWTQYVQEQLKNALSKSHEQK